MIWKSSFIVLGLVSIVVPRISQAEETVRAGEVVVTASRIEEAAEAAASSITVITRKEIEQKQYRTVFDALRDVVGLDAVRSGGPGVSFERFSPRDEERTHACPRGRSRGERSVLGRTSVQLRAPLRGERREDRGSPRAAEHAVRIGFHGRRDQRHHAKGKGAAFGRGER